MLVILTNKEINLVSGGFGFTSDYAVNMFDAASYYIAYEGGKQLIKSAGETFAYLNEELHYWTTQAAVFTVFLSAKSVGFIVKWWMSHMFHKEHKHVS